MLTAPAQGALAVQVRADNKPVRRELAAIEHGPTRREVETERAVLHALHGGCSVPVGAFAQVSGTGVSVDAGVFSPAGDRSIRVQVVGADPAATGAEAARRLLERGAWEILTHLERQPRLQRERGA
jgi:hydroxymethylbilane synthase